MGASGGTQPYLSQAQLSSTYALRGAASGKGTPMNPAVRIDLAGLVAPNAVAPLMLPTPDSTGELTHTSIVYSPDGWNGYKYWMVATPYFASNNQIENPCIYCANDPSVVGGKGWVVPAGLTNPIEPTPPSGGFNSDTDLEFGPDGTLYCFFRQNRNDYPAGTQGTFWAKSSTDGVNWTAKVLIFTYDERVKALASPSVVYDGTAWKCWAIDITPNPNTAVMMTATSPLGPWSAPVTIVMATVDNTRDIWHLDINKFGDQYHCLINECAREAGGGGALLLGTSNDGGLTWALSPTPVITRRPASFDSGMYRSSMIPVQRGDEWGYDIMYVGIGAGTHYFPAYTFLGFNQHRRQVIGAQAGPIHSIAEPSNVNVLASRIPLLPFVFGDAWQRSDAAVLGNAESGQAWTTWGGVPGIVSRQAAPTTAVATRAVIAGSADGYCEMILNAGNIWMIFRGLDTNNLYRVGFSSGAFQMVKIVASASTILNTFGLGAFAAGMRVGVLTIGSQITLYRDGLVVGVWTDAFNATANMTGWQASQTTDRIGPIYARTLVGGA